ncbi:hypothetical protein VNO80_16243 [Phaseolus coccineus]|uniref:Uncharacterized protein n=1 Tax=Phaseolus coccineus TaxID=3886 RepID=A0AAN9MRQ9_PHACN
MQAGIVRYSMQRGTRGRKEGASIYRRRQTLDQTLSSLAFAPSHSLSPNSKIPNPNPKPNLLMKLDTPYSTVSESGSIP